MPASVEKEVIEMQEKISALVEAALEKHIALFKDLKEREMIHEETMAFAKVMARITHDGQVAPVVLKFNRDQKDMYEWSTKRVVDNAHIFHTTKDEEGNYIVFTDSAGERSFYQARMDYAIRNPEKSGYIREVSLSNFTKNNEFGGLIIKDITERQYLNLTRKVWGQENTFSYCATAAKINENGEKTYDIMVAQKDYISGSKLISSDDVFSTLVVYDVFKNDELDKANIYERDLEMKIFNYSDEKPMYVSQLRADGKWLKIDSHSITVMDGGKVERTMIRPVRTMGMSDEKWSELKKNFAIDVYKYYDNFKEPIEITPELEEFIKTKNMTVEDYLAEHSRTGRDNDFKLNKEQDEYARPLKRNQEYSTSLAARKFVSQICHDAGYNIMNKEVSHMISEYVVTFKKRALNSRFTEEEKSQICKLYERNLKQAFTQETSILLNDEAIIKIHKDVYKKTLKEFNTLNMDDIKDEYKRSSAVAIREAKIHEFDNGFDIYEQHVTRYTEAERALYETEAINATLTPLKEINESYSNFEYKFVEDYITTRNDIFEKTTVDEILKNKKDMAEIRNSEEYKEMISKWYSKEFANASSDLQRQYIEILSGNTPVKIEHIDLAEIEKSMKKTLTMDKQVTLYENKMIELFKDDVQKTEMIEAMNVARVENDYCDTHMHSYITEDGLEDFTLNREE